MNYDSTQPHNNSCQNESVESFQNEYEPQAKLQFSQSETPHIPVVWWVASQVFAKACVRRRMAVQKVFLWLPMSQHSVSGRLRHAPNLVDWTLCSMKLWHQLRVVMCLTSWWKKRRWRTFLRVSFHHFNRQSRIKWRRLHWSNTSDFSYIIPKRRLKIDQSKMSLRERKWCLCLVVFKVIAIFFK